MEFPSVKKKVKDLLSSVECVVNDSKRIIYSVSLLKLSSGSSTAQTQPPAAPKKSLQQSLISNFSTRSFPKLATVPLYMMLAQHRSRSSHRSLAARFLRIEAGYAR